MKRIFAILVALIALVSITAIAENEVYKSGDYSYTLNPDGTAIITKYSGRERNLAIPSFLDGHTVTGIGDKAFYFCYFLTSVQIPGSVSSIGNDAFSGSSLTNVQIPDSVTSIGDSAFCLCISLTDVQIPGSVSSIGDSAFEGCSSLTSVQIPDSVTSIGVGAFYECSKSLTLTVGRDSYAKQYAIDHGISYTYPDALDWLK